MAQKGKAASHPPISDRALNRATLARQMLLRREKATPVAVIERLAGMQAQLARPPFVGLWSRIHGFRAADLIKAIDRRDVVRGTLMRGTLHLVSRKDYLAFRAVIQPVLTAGLQAILKRTCRCARHRRPPRRGAQVLRRRAAHVRRIASAPDLAVPEGRRACHGLCRADAPAARSDAAGRLSMGVSGVERLRGRRRLARRGAEET